MNQITRRPTDTREVILAKAFIAVGIIGAIALIVAPMLEVAFR